MTVRTIRAIFVPGVIPNPQASEWKGAHWSKRARLAKSLRETTGMYILLAAGRRRRVPARVPKMVTFTAFVGNAYDDDNLRTALKPYRDALKDMQIIDDDRVSSGHTFVYQQIVKRGKDAVRGVQIVVEGG